MELNREYTLLQKGPYYCAAGKTKAFGRDMVDDHDKARLSAGINIGGIIGEVSGSSKLAPAVGISAGDELWVARYILERITEIAGVVLSFDPKPIQGDWNGCTKSMRCDGYGEGNERRLTGRHETADINTFLWVISKTGGQHQTRIPMSSLP